MNKIQENTIEEFVKTYNLGENIVEIKRITGGLSHRMFKVTTNKGTYAIKQLNDGVMKRKEAYSNYIFANKVTNIMKNKINVVCEIPLKNQIINTQDNMFFMVFDWIDGKVLKAEEIAKEHTKIMANVLADIHNTDFLELEDEKRKIIETRDIDWNKYLKIAKDKNKNYVDTLTKEVNLLYELTEKAKKALNYAKNNLIISHRDLDRKNVIWQDFTPFIIDWEASRLYKSKY